MNCFYLNTFYSVLTFLTFIFLVFTIVFYLCTYQIFLNFKQMTWHVILIIFFFILCIYIYIYIYMYIYLLSFTGKFVYIYVWYLKTNYKLCVYFHVGVNIFHWCSFLHSFHTPFQNSPYGHRTDAFFISFMFF